MAIFLERMNKINQRNELRLMPLVNFFPILKVLSRIKILYSHEFMMKKSSMLITNCQNNCNYKFTTLKRDRSKEYQKEYILNSQVIISFPPKKKKKNYGAMEA